MTKYYFDTCIWRDHYENRIGSQGRPLGKYATNLFANVIKNQDTLLFSEFIIRELKNGFNEKEISEMLNVLYIAGILEKVTMKEEDYKEAKRQGMERNLPAGDVLHALLARKNNAIFVTQDNHCLQLKDIVEVKKPEEII
jgi:predicted nucleic acid-binding protein